MTIRGVIFDLDGTLVDSGLDFPKIRREMGLPERVPILEALAEIPPGEHLANCLAILDRHEDEAAQRATLMPGAQELLASLAARCIPQAILTRNSRAGTSKMLNRLGLSFACVLTRDDGPPKPDPTGLLKICSIWKAGVTEVIYVGDYLHDVNCGRNAGIRTILLAPGDPPHYATLADFCVSSLNEVAHLIDELIAGPPRADRVKSVENGIGERGLIG
jgi:HAD superfamily hydrolase (TIGR01549 family)